MATPSATRRPLEPSSTSKSSTSGDEVILAASEVSGPARLRHVDGLRGVAALTVVVFHAVYFSPAKRELIDLLGPLARLWAHFGELGVDIFFLLSGFVLMRSLSGDRVSLDKFILRRQLRLDPVYWVAIVVTLVLWQVERLTIDIRHLSLSPLDVAANVTYVQYIVHRPDVISVSWTLCFEVQMYLALVAVVATTRHLPAAARPALIAVTGLAATTAPWFSTPTHAIAFSAWPLFCVGVLLFELQRDRRWLYVAGALLVATIGANGWLAFGVCAAAATTLVMRTPLHALLESAPLQWFGLRSYSLYLFHSAAISVVARTSYTVSESTAVAAAMAVVSIGAAIVAAAVAYAAIERPCVELAAATKTMPLAELLSNRARRARAAIARGR